MNNNNSNSQPNELDKMVRARSVYVSSESLPFDSDVSSAIYQLQEPIAAQEGFDLVYGVRAFGFNASVTNISRKQRNNTLTFETNMSPPEYIYDDELNIFVVNGDTTPIVTKHKVSFPEGLYTIDDLFAMLSSEQNYAIFSGYQIDVKSYQPYYENLDQGTTEPNKLFIKASFSRSSGGFTVKPEISSSTIINIYVSNITPTSDVTNSGYQVNFKLHSFSIIRDPDDPGLYDLLFTNLYTDSKDHAPEVPAFETIIKGRNPPQKITFNTTIDLYDISTGSSSTLLEAVSPQASMTYVVNYEGDEDIDLKLASKYPSNGFLAPYRGARFYHLPLINPLYIDVISDLPTMSVTTEGGKKGILVRQFALGGDNGGTSFFQSYDNPIWYRTSSSKETIDSIRLNFQSEGNKWNFFNLEFFLELVVYEYPQQSIQTPDLSSSMNSNTSGRSYYMPSEDEITATMGPDHNPFPFRHLGNDQSVVYFNNPLDAKLKRRRK
jgi:hypothetical protein